jgi:hypothetical protein
VKIPRKENPEQAERTNINEKEKNLPSHLPNHIVGESDPSPLTRKFGMSLNDIDTKICQ